MRKAGALLALLAGLYSALAAIITLIVLGGIGSSASVELRGVWLGWSGLAFSFLIIILGASPVYAPHLKDPYIFCFYVR